MTPTDDDRDRPDDAAGVDDDGNDDAADADADTTVTNIEVERAREVRITFGDGKTCAFPLLPLRLACPCATCRGQREAGQRPWPRAGAPTPLAIVDAELVGAWGISFTWNDGHATGIYPWSSMRKWCDADDLALPPDDPEGL